LGNQQRAIETQQLSAEPRYEPIEIPRNSPTGFITAFFSTMTGFALIWHIWWMVGLGLLAAYAGLRVVRVARRSGVLDSGGGRRPLRSRAQASPRAMARATRWSAGMSATDTPFERTGDPYRVGRSRDWVSTSAGRGYVHATGHGEGGPASKRVIVGYGSGSFCSATS